MDNKIPLYRQLANELETQIESGVFQAGEKLPSVRNFALSRKISVITVLKAYQILMHKSLIHSLPKSGYYISFHNVINQNTRKTEPQEVHISEKVHDFTKKNIPVNRSFAEGIPGRDIIPLKQMNKILSRELNKDTLPQLSSIQNEGYDLFRAQIVKYLYVKNVNTAMENILITNGCTEAIYLCFATLCNPGDQIVMQSPCSYGVLQMAETLKLKVLELNADHEKGIEIGHLQYFLDNYDIKAIYLNPNVNNPLGTIIPNDTKKGIAELVNRKKVFLIEDDVMSDLHFGSDHPLPIKSFDIHGHVIYCSSFTKTLLPTYRIGWICTDLLLDRILQTKHAVNVGTQLLQQVVLAELLETGNYDRYTRKARKIYAERVHRLREDILSSFPEGTQVSSPQGGFQLWVRLPDHTSPFMFFDRLTEENIYVLPGELFSLNDRYLNYFRVSAANYGEAMVPALMKMAEAAGDATRPWNPVLY